MKLSEARKDEQIEDLQYQLQRVRFEVDRLRETNAQLLRENSQLHGKLAGRNPNKEIDHALS